MKTIRMVLPSSTRKIDLTGWKCIHDVKPPQGVVVVICDADDNGFADFEYYAILDNDTFYTKTKLCVSAHTISYWRHLSAKELKDYKKQ